MEEVPEKLPFMATSCCPSWSMMAKKFIPGTGEMYLHGTDTYGSYCQADQAEGTGL